MKFLSRSFIYSLFLFGLICALILASGFVQPEKQIRAESFLQNAPSFEGYKIYFSESNREPSRFDRTPTGISRYARLLESLGAELYTLEWRDDLPEDADLIVIPGPLADLTTDQVTRLWLYMLDGGRVLLATELLDFRQALRQDRGFFELFWVETGVRVRNDTIVFAPLEQPAATDPSASPVLQIDFVTDVLNPDNPITSTIDGGLAFFGARSIELDNFAIKDDVVVEPLIFTDSLFYGESAYLDYLETGAVEYNVGVDTGRGSLPLAASISFADTSARLILIGDRDFMINGKGLQTSPSFTDSFVFPGNVNFLLQATSWLLETEVDIMEFPTPGATDTPTLTPSPTPLFEV